MSTPSKPTSDTTDPKNMVEEQTAKGTELDAEKELQNSSKNGVKKDTPNSPQPAPSFVDSSSGGIASLKDVLNIPLEETGGNKSTPLDVPSDPLGMGGPYGEKDELGMDLPDDMESLEDMFDDTDALAEFGVEILDLGMSYASQAISGDWGEDDKYSIPETRKRKLRKPLAALLKKRAPKVSPELAFAVFVLGAYAPVLIKAYQERQKKQKESAKKAGQGTQPLVVPKDGLPSDYPSGSNNDDDGEDFDALIREMRSEAQEQPQKRIGRPPGSKDKKPRRTSGYKKAAAQRKSTVKKTEDSTAS